MGGMLDCGQGIWAGILVISVTSDKFPPFCDPPSPYWDGLLGARILYLKFLQTGLGALMSQSRCIAEEFPP